MPLIASLIAKVTTDFPDLIFAANDEFRWSPDEQTVFYEKDSEDLASFLHELSHAILNHKEYARDIGLLELERAAWTYAQENLSGEYGVVIDTNQVEDSLDTYRNWLHARSTCPSCKATGFEVKKAEYKCPACSSKWRVNDARVCALRRYTVA
jgi:predicted Zn-ribbon and HTH transcriptional regulator